MNRRSLLALLLLPRISHAQATYGKVIVSKMVKEILHPDGQTTVWTLSYAPQNNQSFDLLYNGVAQVEGKGYTLAGKTLTVTFANPPTAQDDLWCKYLAEFSV